jgi:hypothetical protein
MADSVPAPAPEEPFPLGSTDSTHRYVQECLLGQGAMGAVYLVRDRETGERLALKKLFQMDPRSVLRLKREFRAVADMSHPNLVKVYELGHGPDGFFLAMEYVAGKDLQAHLGLATSANACSRLDAALVQFTSRRAWLQESLLPAFRQLASGVSALHRAGMLHRDLKPSNVLVSNHRVVVLDFGLIRSTDPNAPALTEDGAIAGTPAYMAPEQALGKPLSEASDWYAFGVMLYEALTGALPFEGTLMDLLRAKLDRDPPRADTLNPEIPSHLSALCTALLARDPLARPCGSDVLACLAHETQPTAASSASASGDTSIRTATGTAAAAPFFGRKRELSTLWDIAKKIQAGQSQVVHVRGISGTGKSALTEHFLDQLDDQTAPGTRADFLVLRSRCYEREAMPFKALDGVIDALTRYLSQLDDVEVGHLLPTDIVALTQLFPVLERLRAVQRLLNARSLGTDAVHNRQRAEIALRDLFSRLAARQPVVIWIDDVQWGDLDSARILKGFLQRALELPLLLLLSYRSDEVETSECLRLLLQATDGEVSAPTTLLDVSALAPDELSALSRAQLGPLAFERGALIERIVREADGSPFLAAQLTAIAQAKLARGDTDTESISLADLVTQTGALLPADARHFLRVLAIAGRPLAPKLALRAAGLRKRGREIVHALRQQLLVRTRDVGGEKLIEVYHDRVRESVQRAIEPAAVELLHNSLLQALEYSGQTDPDWLYAHAVGAKQWAAALRYGLAAAERALSTLAFEHAAELYAQCNEMDELAPQERGALVCKLADALACCGRGGRAADAYMQAAALATGGESVKLTRLATSQLFRSGRFDEGETMLRRALVAMNVRMPETPLAVMLALSWERLRAALRGSRFTVRSEAEVPAALLERIDAFSLLRADLQSLDPLRAAWFVLRALRWALDAGEPTRVLLALGGLCQLMSMRGTRAAQRRSEALLKQIAALAERIGTPVARSVLCATQALSLWQRGWVEAVLDPSYEAEKLCREQAADQVGGYHRRFAVVSARIGALYTLKDYRAFATELQSALAEARATENRAALLVLALNETLLEELLDRSHGSIARLSEQRLQLPSRGFGVYHALHMIAVCVAAADAGQYDWGRRVLDEDWPRFLRSPVRRTTTIRAYAQGCRARLLLNQYVDDGKPRPRSLGCIRAEVEQYERLARGQPSGAPYFPLGARLAYLDNDRAGAVELLRRAITAGRQEVQPARYALGRLLGGTEGAVLCAESQQRLLELGVVNPIKYLNRQFPELFVEH